MESIVYTANFIRSNAKAYGHKKIVIEELKLEETPNDDNGVFSAFIELLEPIVDFL
jgi:hypothetical protein